MTSDEDFQWQPPSEAEMKILEARRERSDKISKLMGDYLLKGYKMLGNVCEVCDTILLEDKQAQKYCIACRELETTCYALLHLLGPKLYKAGEQHLQKISGGSQGLKAHHISACNSAVDSLCDKIKWASEELKHSSGVEYSIQLCNLIKASADALQSLKSVH
ncbi:protein ZNRD2-like [Saccostrea cucullata]|uniref:protein ZNRD2-like n=1 Tax=Saccostrea cuccullata TaxID=36930 RepID=UPI002ED3144D